MPVFADDARFGFLRCSRMVLYLKALYVGNAVLVTGQCHGPIRQFLCLLFWCFYCFNFRLEMGLQVYVSLVLRMHLNYRSPLCCI